MGRQRTTGSRLRLGEPLASDLADFCAAHYDIPELNIVRVALREFIDARLASEPEMRKRFESARKERLKDRDVPLSVVQSDDN